MKSSDVIIIGAGIIGLSLAIELRKKGMRVLVVERGKAGREASYAAAGMLVASGDEIPAALKPLAEESARIYPEFVHELEDESGLKIDLREQGTIVVSCDGHLPTGAELLSPQRLRSLEPAIDVANSPLLPKAGRNGAPIEVAGDPPETGWRGRARLQNQSQICAAYMPERSVDPRALVVAAIKAARHREVDISSGAEVRSLTVEAGRVSGVRTDKTTYAAGLVVNCAGAWAGSIEPYEFPVRPVKGQMLAVVEAPPLRHVVRSKQVYLVPRSDGRLVIGSTIEDAGFNKQTDVDTLKLVFDSAVELVPGVAKSRRNEAWAGLRPGTPDELPILGETATSGFFMAAGHYRDGILLAPITARVMADMVLEGASRYDLGAFSPNRFMR